MLAAGPCAPTAGLVQHFQGCWLWGGLEPTSAPLQLLWSTSTCLPQQMFTRNHVTSDTPYKCSWCFSVFQLTTLVTSSLLEACYSVNKLNWLFWVFFPWKIKGLSSNPLCLGLKTQDTKLFFPRALNRCSRQKEEMKAEKPPMYEKMLPVLNKG